MLKMLAGIAAPLILKKALRRQSKIGYRIAFKDLPPDWLQAYVQVDMTQTWHKYGLPINGVNYFTLGAIKDGVSTRYIKSDPLYQAWFGGYLFTFEKPVEWTIRDYAKLAEADQKKWLRYYGVKKPVMDFGDPTQSKDVRDIDINGINGRLFRWGGLTQSDVGPRSNQFYNRAAMECMAKILNLLNPGQSVLVSDFIPKDLTGEAYEAIQLYGYMAVMDISPTIKAVLYICMVDDGLASRQKMESLIRHNIELLQV